MNIFRTIASKAHPHRHDTDPPISDLHAEPTPPAQHESAPANGRTSKADDMMRLLSERRKRLKI